MKTMFTLASLMFCVTIVAGAEPNAAGHKPSSSSCVTCHGKLDGPELAPVSAWPADVHAAAGLGCESCHGGDPSAALAEDAATAMDPKRGFVGAPNRLRVAEFCARCHSDAAFMKQYNPKLRVDQFVEYRTSKHGKLNAAGDPVPATCTNCHGSHGIHSVSSPDSPAYASNVPATCAKCHADAKVMAPYGIPTTQYADFRNSVHGAALLEEGDTSAPACNDCHGNHGATPPGVRSVAHVCGQCHGREAALYGASFKKDLFEAAGLQECTVCHDHHRIQHPTPELFHGAAAPEVEAGKVTGTDPFTAELGDLTAGQTKRVSWRAVLRPRIDAADARLVHEVEIAAEGVSPLRIDATVRPGESPAGAGRTVTASGLTATLTLSPLSGVPVEAGDAVLFQLAVQAGPGGPLKDVKVQDRPGPAVVSLAGSACRNCHEAGDDCDKATGKMYEALSALDVESREASALLRRAELAGMEVGAAKFELKSKGVTAAIEARSLIHTFDPDKLVQRTAEGREVARGALAAAKAALAELEYRRRGLATSLVLIGLVLVGLYLKIRQVDRSRETRL